MFYDPVVADLNNYLDQQDALNARDNAFYSDLENATTIQDMEDRDWHVEADELIGWRQAWLVDGERVDTCSDCGKILHDESINNECPYCGFGGHDDD